MKSSFTNGKGDVIIEYTGRMYPFANTLKNFKTLYDPNQDYLVSCNDCIKNRIKSFKKIRRQ